MDCVVVVFFALGRGAPVFLTCVDCLKDFKDQEYVAHTKVCVFFIFFDVQCSECFALMLNYC